jgi:hypothetical protein
LREAGNKVCNIKSIASAEFYEACVKLGKALSTSPTLDDLNAYVESEIERRLVVIGDIKVDEWNMKYVNIIENWPQKLSANDKLYALRKAE